MSLKYRLSLYVSLLFLFSGLASVAVNRLVIMPSFLALEREQAQRNTGRAAEAINRDLEVLSTGVTSWAQWDESKRFMDGENDAFVERELNAEAVASAEISYMGFYRQDGTQVTHRAPGAAEPTSPGFGPLQQPALPADHPLLQFRSIEADAKGLVATPSGPMLVASRPILNSSGEGPSSGVLIFGRLLDEETVERIAKQYKLDLAVRPASEAGIPGNPDRRTTDWKPGGPLLGLAIGLSEEGSILKGETVVSDIFGDPIVRMQVSNPRAISARGEEASRFALATLVVVAFAVLGLLLAVVHGIVLHPIARLTAHAVDVGNNDALHKRIAWGRKDELGVLAAEFDRMTDHLVEARQRLVDQSFVLGKADMAAGILHNIGNAVTPIAVRLNTLSDRVKAAPCDDLEQAVAELESGTGSPERRSDLARFVQLAGLELAGIASDALEHLRGTIAQVEHVQQILGQQELYSRAGGAAESVALEPLIRRVAEGLSPDLLRVIDLDIDTSVHEAGAVRGTRVEIQQIVGNLILNAAESIKSHCISDGRIRVCAAPEPGDPAQLHLTFEDNGAGIDPPDLQKMFDRGFSTKRRGTGLGLHWSANSVAALGGKLYAQSRGVGQGATLHLLLPLAAESTPGASPALAKNT